MTTLSATSTLDALQGALRPVSQSDSWGGAERIPTAGTMQQPGSNAYDSILGSGQGDAMDPFELESSHLMRTGKEPTQEEIMEYLQRHKLQSFLTEVVMHVARHFPVDPFDFLLNHIYAMVMKHKAAQAKGAGASETKADSCIFPAPLVVDPPQDVPPEQRQRIVQHVAVVLRQEGTTNASAKKFFQGFSTSARMTEADFSRLLEHLQSSWGLHAQDCKLMLEGLNRWRFRANVAKGTRGLPLWPMAYDEFAEAYVSLLRMIRDRYVPIGGRIHRSLFVRQAQSSLEKDYRLGAKLGRGAFGEVSLVILKATGEKRVSKRIERTQQKVPEEELLSEVDMLRGLDHPHIIRVFEFFENEEFTDMIMEPVFGGTLTHIVRGLHVAPSGEALRQRPAALKESWLATVTGQLLSALAYAHEVAGVIHKDLKTDNVLMVGRPQLSAEEMLSEPVHAMLADFGIAEVFAPVDVLRMHVPPPAVAAGGQSQDTTSSSGTLPTIGRRSERVGGTPSYMSPEMFRGSFTEKSDIWSLGVIVFCVMTGELPYKADNLLMQAHAVCNPRKHPPWELLSLYKWGLGARWFCQQLLSKDEAMRPSAVEASRDPWLSKLIITHDHVPPSESERTALHAQHLESHLMKMACSCVVSQLSLSQLHHLNLRFKEYDTSGDGRLGHVEVRQLLADVGVAPEEVEIVIESLDSDHSGVIEYSEFIAGSIDIADSDMRKQLRVAFNIFDLDNSGSISLDELTQVLTQGPNSTALPIRPSSPDFTGASAGNGWASPAGSRTTGGDADHLLPDGRTSEEVMSEMDVNHGGSVEFAEFERCLLEEHRKSGERLHAANAGAQ